MVRGEFQPEKTSVYVSALREDRICNLRRFVRLDDQSANGAGLAAQKVRAGSGIGSQWERRMAYADEWPEFTAAG